MLFFYIALPEAFWYYQKWLNVRKDGHFVPEFFRSAKTPPRELVKPYYLRKTFR